MIYINARRPLGRPPAALWDAEPPGFKPGKQIIHLKASMEQVVDKYDAAKTARLLCVCRLALSDGLSRIRDGGDLDSPRPPHVTPICRSK